MYISDKEHDDENYISKDELLHYGTPKHSGRYPYGSGDNPYQRSGDFLSRYDELKSAGNSEKDIAEIMKMTTTQLRARKAIANNERRSEDVAKAKALREEGKSLNEIADIMGFNNDSSVRSLLNEQSEVNMNKAVSTAEFLKSKIDEKGILDVGEGVERDLGISTEKLNQALVILQDEGYKVYGNLSVRQATNNGQLTTLKLVCPKDTTYDQAYKAKEAGDVESVAEYHSFDDGVTFDAPKRPSTISSDRISIQYGDKGGADKDGLIEIRRGVDDLSLGNSHYAQVRISVDGTHFLKGMAIYSDDLPKGTDIRFNTNKPSGTDKMKVLKPLKDDKDNPFGATITAAGQSTYIGKDGKQHLSPINKLRDEGEVGQYKKTLSSQFLAKQPMTLINSQLRMAYSDKEDEYNQIMQLTNPTIKKNQLLAFSKKCDAQASNLDAAALPRQKYQVILPVPSLKDNEVYAPNFKNGETIALIRYPHGGTFEIPIVKVNNKQADGKKIVGNALDAIGINGKVAARLSGADFDGDTVLAIPTGKNKRTNIVSTKALEGLKGFDPKEKYAYHEGMTTMKKGNVQVEMGKISNLITDMTIKGATSEELAKAVRHSMVIIDAYKHELDYKQSAKDNDIALLTKKYKTHINEQGKESSGAATLLSAASSEVRVPATKGSPRIDPDTGEFIYKESGESYINESGKKVIATKIVTKMSTVKDAHILSTGSKQEEAYADFANKLKALGNKARKSILATEDIPYSKSAKILYQKEFDSLNAKLNIALKNAPRERKAQVIATGRINAKKKANPDMTKEEIRKVKQQEIIKARAETGSSSKYRRIDITDKEWEAIQAGAISKSKLEDILNNTDIEALKQRATPRSSNTLSISKINKIEAMHASGYTNEEIAESIGVSASTISKELSGGK